MFKLSAKMKGYSPREFIALLIQKGYSLNHKKGSHHTYAHPNKNKIITIPMARKEICRPLTKRLLKQIGTNNE